MNSIAARHRCPQLRSVILSAAKNLHLLLGSPLRIHPVQSTPIIGRLNVVPVPAQINPSGVGPLDERELPLAQPSLEHLLARNGLRHLLKALKPHQAIAVISGGEAIVLRHLCSKTRLWRLPVTPMYRVRLRLAMM